MGSAFWEGVISGAASSTDRALQAHLKKQEDRFDSTMNYLLQDAVAKRGVYDKDKREAEKALKAMYGLVGNWNDAQLAIETLGGVSKDGANITKFIQDYQEALKTNENLSVQDVLKYTGEQQGNMTSTQAVNNMVQPFSYELPSLYPKQAEGIAEQGIWSLFGKKNRDQQLREEMTARGIPMTRAGAASAKQAMVARAGGDPRKVSINWGALGQKQQQEAVKTKQAIAVTKQQLSMGEQKLLVLKDEVAQLPEVNRRSLQTHQVNMADKQTSIADRAAKAVVFAQRNDRKTVELDFQIKEADLAKKRSGNDAEEYWNILDVQENIYRSKLRGAGSAVTRQTKEWQLQIENIKTSKNNLVGIMAADASTVYSKDSPKGIFKEKLQATLQSIPGLKYSDNLAGMIQELTEGQAPFVLAAYQDHAKEMRRIYQNNPHRGIQDQLKIADSNSKLAENMVFKKMWETPKKIRPPGIPWRRGMKTIAAPPKNLYLTDADGKVRLDKEGFAMYNPEVKQGDRVIINDSYTLERRARRMKDGTGGYLSKEGIYTNSGIIGYRPAGNKNLLWKR